jgi:hypothetical protein
MHVTIHTSQTWADTFISELNDTHVEAELRTKHIPPQVPPGRQPEDLLNLGHFCFKHVFSSDVDYHREIEQLQLHGMGCTGMQRNL